MNKPRSIEVSHKPITPPQERLCRRFIDTFGVSLFEVVDTTFFSCNLSLNLFDFAIVSFAFKKGGFTLSYEIDELSYGFMLSYEDGDSAFFPIRNILLFWQQNKYNLDDFIEALQILSKTTT